MISHSDREQHLAMSQAVGFSEVSDRTQVEILGKDRAQLLHGLCTNDIKRLKPGEGCEAFLTNVQGRTIGYVYVFCTQDSLVLESVAGVAANLIRDLDRFVIREDVQFVDRASDWCEFLIAGPNSAACLQQLLSIDPPELPLTHVSSIWLVGKLNVRRVPFTGPHCFFVMTERAIAAEFSEKLAAFGAVPCNAQVVDVARIEAGSPVFGQDITDDNLPQEVDRTPLAISFTKGCYLGQETVARLDALGHVNRSLCGVRFAGPDMPTANSEIRIQEKGLGRVTSVCWSARLDSPLALAYLRGGHNQIGTRFQSPWGESEVVRLPLS